MTCQSFESDGQTNNRSTRKRFDQPRGSVALAMEPISNVRNQPGLTTGIPEWTALRNARDVDWSIGSVAHSSSGRKLKHQRTWLLPKAVVIAIVKRLSYFQDVICNDFGHADYRCLAGLPFPRICC